MVLRLHQHNIGYTVDGFYRSKDPTNSVKALKEGIVIKSVKWRSKLNNTRNTLGFVVKPFYCHPIISCRLVSLSVGLSVTHIIQCTLC